jgi:hypothetical protein
LSTVSAELAAATTSAGHHACAKAYSETPSFERIAAMVANAYAPIVTPVSGG